MEELCARANLDNRYQALLADAGTLKGLSGHRHQARWAVEGVEKQLFGDGSVRDDPVSLPVPSAGEDMHADYASIGLTLGRYPLALLRKQLSAHRYRRSRDLLLLAHGTPVHMPAWSRCGNDRKLRAASPSSRWSMRTAWSMS